MGTVSILRMKFLAVSSSEDAAIFFFTKNTLVKKGAPWKQELH